MQEWLAAMAMLLVVGCIPIVNHRGHVEQDKMLDTLEVGMSQEDVLRRFGSPSSEASFGDTTWYYAQTRKESEAFLKPEITEQKVVAVTFDATGRVSAIETYGLDDRMDVVMVDETTPTEGHSISFFEQVLGNLGRFNAPRDTQMTPGTARR